MVKEVEVVKEVKVVKEIQSLNMPKRMVLSLLLDSFTELELVDMMKEIFTNALQMNQMPITSSLMLLPI